MKSFKRSQRVADQIQRDASEIVSDFARDEAGLFVTISRVEMTDDLRYARVLYTVLGGEENKARAAELFKHATGYIQSELARRLRIRRMPEITMQFDKALVEGLRVSELIDRVMDESDKNDDSAE